MRFIGLRLFARAGAASTLRQIAQAPIWLASVLVLAADIIDPVMPESLWRPREWLWRLWSRAPRPRRSDLAEPPR